MHCGCLFVGPNVLVLDRSTIIRGAMGTIPWYDLLVRLVGKRILFYHNYKKSNCHHVNETYSYDSVCRSNFDDK